MWPPQSGTPADMDWVGSSLVVLSVSLLALKLYRHGWVASLCACMVWGVVALDSGMWGLLAQQAVLAAISVKGLSGCRL